MPILHLGVVDFPYKAKSEGGRKPKRKKAKGKRKPPAPSLTTGDVAEILEDKYHVLEIFYNMKKGKIAGALEGSIKGALESLMMGAPPSHDPFGSGTSKITEMMKKFLADREMERIGYPGVPTKAALKGVNHRKLHPYAKSNPRRPSFIDTTQYQSSLKAWMD